MKIECLIAALVLPLALLAGTIGSPSPADSATAPSLHSATMQAFDALSWAQKKAKLALDGEDAWRVAAKADSRTNNVPVRLSWSGTSGACEVTVREDASKKVVLSTTVTGTAVDVHDLQVGRNYEWTVKNGTASATWGFTTPRTLPRIINKTFVSNLSTCRDLGGYVTAGGKVVKQGMLFRSGHVVYGAYVAKNERNALFDHYWNEVVGLKTEIDLRTPDYYKYENAEYGYTGSPFGPNVTFWNAQEQTGYEWGYYTDVFTKASAKNALKATFLQFCDAAKYPIDFHCSQGRDRTGTLAFFLLGVLGVSLDDVYLDYCFTDYCDNDDGGEGAIEDTYAKLAALYPDATYPTLQQKCVAYLKSLGVTDEQIAAYREIMLEDAEEDDWDGLAVDYGREVGRIRPELHSAGYLPSMWKLGELDWSDDLRALNLYGMRTHDLALQNGALRVCDVWNIFPLLHRDATDPKAYYFKPTDDLLAFAQTNLGFKVFFRLGTSIEHTKDKFFNTKVETKDYAKLADVFCGIVRHYTAGWADGFTWDIPYWEIWNEPDLGNSCWGGTRDQFAEFFATVLKKLKTEFPNLKIGGPAMTSFGASQQEWFAAIFSACQKKGILPDFISYHRYTTSMSVLINEIKTARQWLDDRGYGNIELILNEWHYDLGNNEAKSGPFTVTALAQFQYLPLDQAYFYGCNYAGSYGIVNNSTNEKLPSYYALKLFGEVVRDYTWLCKGGGLADGTVLAALSGDRTKGCLIVSEPKSTKPVVRLRGIEGLSNVRCRIFDGTGDLAPATADWSPGEQTLTLTRRSVATSFLVTFDVQLKGGAK